MTTIDQLLTEGIYYKGYVIKHKNAVRSKPYKGGLSYVHLVLIRFDLYPDTEIECSYMSPNMESDLFSEGEYVRVLIRNFFQNNYGIYKDVAFIHSIEKETMEQTEFLIPKTLAPAGVDSISYMMNSAIMGAATYCQYRPDCDPDKFYAMIKELFDMQQLKQPQK
jgi:hypothetical protein